MRVAFRFYLLLCVLLLTGCSGDVGVPTGLLTRAVTFNVEWGRVDGKAAPRSRDDLTIVPPSQSKSAVLTLLAAVPNKNGGFDDLTMTVNRAVTQTDQTLTQSYPVDTVKSPVRVGATVLIVTCYPQPEAKGTEIGSLVNPNIKVNSAATTIPVSTVALPTSLSIVPGQTFNVGEPMDLQFTALDDKGNNVVLNPKDVTLTVQTGADLLTTVGISIVGLRAGKPTLTATTNNVTSAPQTVTVKSKIRVAIDPPQATVDVQVGTQQFKATVTTTDGPPPSNPGVIWRVQEGDVGGTITQDGLYTAPPRQGAGVYHVLAISQTDTGQAATATVNVVAGDGNVTIK